MMQLSFDLDISRGRHVSTSRAAHARVKPRKSEMRTRIYEMLKIVPGGLTAKEIAAYFDVEIHCLSGRCSEMLALGLIRRTEERRDRSAVLVVTR